MTDLRHWRCPTCTNRTQRSRCVRERYCARCGVWCERLGEEPYVERMGEEPAESREPAFTVVFEAPGVFRGFVAPGGNA